MPDIPQAFLERVADSLGDELPAFLHALGEEPVRALRLNPFKPAPGEAPGLGERVPWEETGYYLSADSAAGAHPLHECGAWYIQEASAMLPAAVLGARPGERVLDLCAAPGGKTTQLGLRMGGEGLLVCNEPVPGRAQILSRNVERMGLPNALVVSALPETLARRWPGGFDAVMVDAPCSGEGMFRRHPETRGEWSREMAEGCAQRQAGILDSAADLVRPGGRLVYSTCTFNPRENEENVAAFLQRHPDFAPASFRLPGIDAPEGCFTLWPHRLRGEGQFAALLIRRGDEPASLPPDASLPRPDKAALSAVYAFAPAAPAADALLGQTLTCLPGCPDLRGLRVYRRGLHLGGMKGKIFAPDHAWALSIRPPEAQTISLTPDQARAYQAGEALRLPAPASGFALLTLSGLPLGWGKASGGLVKNHYPKGLWRR